MAVLTPQIGTTNLAFAVAAGYFFDPKSDYRQQVLDLVPGANFIEKFYTAGAIEPTTSGTYRTRFMNEDDFDVPTTGATVTANAPAFQATITNLPANIVGGLQRGYLLANSANGQTYLILSVSTTGARPVVIQHVKNSAITLVAGNLLKAFSNAQPIEGGTVDPRTQTMDEWFNRVQIIRTAAKWGDVASGQAIPVTGQNGEKFDINMGQARSIREHQLAMGLACLIGTRSDTAWTDAAPTLVSSFNQKAVQTTGGKHELIGMYGQQSGVATPGAMTVADWRNLTALLRAGRFATDFNIEGSGAAIEPMQAGLVGMGVTQIANAHMTFNNQTLDLNIQKFSTGGFNFSFDTNPIYDHRAVPSYVRNAVHIVPSGQTEVKDLRGKTVNAPYESLRIYDIMEGGASTFSSDGLDARLKTVCVEWGAIGNKPSGDVMVAASELVTYVGYDMGAPAKTLRYNVL